MFNSEKYKKTEYTLLLQPSRAFWNLESSFFPFTLQIKNNSYFCYRMFLKEEKPHPFNQKDLVNISMDSRAGF